MFNIEHYFALGMHGKGQNVSHLGQPNIVRICPVFYVG